MIVTSSTRWVILTPKHALKLPAFKSWRCFLRGLAANRHEVKALEALKGTIIYSFFCPILFSLPLGLLNIMPRCEHLTHNEWYDPETIKLIQDLSRIARPLVDIEYKHDSFAWYNTTSGERRFKLLVAVDYGS